MNTKKLAAAAVLAFGLAMAPSANAQLIGSTVNITGDNGFQGGPPCKDVAVSRTVLGGGELLGSDWTNNCVGYYSADINNAGFTLTVRDGGNYSLGHLNLLFSGASTITGASFLGYSNFLDPNYVNNDSNFNPVVSFTGNSVSVVWDTGNDSQQFAYNFNAVNSGTAQFSIQTTRTVAPEPATFVLLGAGLGIVGFVGRRRRA